MFESLCGGTLSNAKKFNKRTILQIECWKEKSWDDFWTLYSFNGLPLLLFPEKVCEWRFLTKHLALDFIAMAGCTSHRINFQGGQRGWWQRGLQWFQFGRSSRGSSGKISVPQGYQEKCQGYGFYHTFGFGSRSSWNPRCWFLLALKYCISSQATKLYKSCS